MPQKFFPIQIFGYVQKSVDFHCRRTLSAGTASASSRNPLCGVFRHVLFPLESPPSVPINEGRALHDVESFKRQHTQQVEDARILREDMLSVGLVIAVPKSSMRPRRA